MSIFIRSLIFITFLIAASPVFASAKAELKVWKFNEQHYGLCGFCGDFIGIDENKDLGDFRSFYLFTADGYYTAELTGPTATTVTLFGRQEYAVAGGFLIIVKKDDLPVSVEDLNDFAPKTWVEVPASKGKGSYSAYYHPRGGFKYNVSSVKWGQWWSDLPVNEK